MLKGEYITLYYLNCHEPTNQVHILYELLWDEPTNQGNTLY